MINETEKRIEAVKTAVIRQEASSDNSVKNCSSPESIAPTNSQRQFFISQLKTLTPTEKRVYELYVEGKSTKEVLAELNIKENTLKYHNRNIYSKLGVSSRKQLIELANMLTKEAEEL